MPVEIPSHYFMPCGSRLDFRSSSGPPESDEHMSMPEGSRFGSIRHIVWDWNGTLFDDREAIIRANDISMRAAGFEGVTPERFAQHFARPTAAFYERVVGRPVDQAECRTLDAGFEKAYVAIMRDFSLAPDALDALDLWAASRTTSGRLRTQSVLSMWGHELLVPFVRELGVEEYFVRVDGRTGPPGGPKRAHLARHVERLQASVPGLAREEILVVGDVADDASAARSVGTACVLHTAGFDGFVTLRGTGAPVVSGLREAVRLALL
ncbi:HAD family hydrolase [Streptomyces sp. 4N509B]|uniref:HAD family hydrolase n=1 Tax=Streptomyces sp. 4N509B TaxID=3457413 RepID=UPI003FCFF8E1